MTPPEPGKIGESLVSARLMMARDDLESAEQVDLATASNAQLVHLVEQLRGDLADVIRIAIASCSP